MTPRSDWSEVAIGLGATFWACWLAFVLSALLFGCCQQDASACDWDAYRACQQEMCAARATYGNATCTPEPTRLPTPLPVIATDPTVQP